MAFEKARDEADAKRPLLNIPVALEPGTFLVPFEAGCLELKGQDALDLLHRLSTNDMTCLAEGSVARTVFTTEKGRVIDYVKVLRLGDRIILLTSSGTAGKVKKWIERFCIMEGIEIRDLTSLTIRYLAFGDDTYLRIGQLVGNDLQPNTVRRIGASDLAFMAVHDLDFGVSWFHIIVDTTQRAQLEQLLRNQFEVASPGVYETFRISKGVPAPECELTGAYNPYETRLQHAISLTKGCYIGQEVLARLETYGKAKRRSLVGLLFDELAISGQKKPVLSRDKVEVGWRTSFSPYPVNGRYLGLGIVVTDQVLPGDRVWLSAGGRRFEATVMEFPFGL
jgi:folate-binding protein YgfZ